MTIATLSFESADSISRTVRLPRRALDDTAVRAGPPTDVGDGLPDRLFDTDSLGHSLQSEQLSGAGYLLYRRVRAVSVRPPGEITVSRRCVLGAAGQSGWGRQNRRFFTV